MFKCSNVPDSIYFRSEGSTWGGKDDLSEAGLGGAKGLFQRRMCVKPFTVKPYAKECVGM